MFKRFFVSVPLGLGVSICLLVLVGFLLGGSLSNASSGQLQVQSLEISKIASVPVGAVLRPSSFFTNDVLEISPVRTTDAIRLLLKPTLPRAPGRGSTIHMRDGNNPAGGYLVFIVDIDSERGTILAMGNDGNASPPLQPIIVGFDNNGVFTESFRFNPDGTLGRGAGGAVTIGGNFPGSTGALKVSGAVSPAAGFGTVLEVGGTVNAAPNSDAYAVKVGGGTTLNRAANGIHSLFSALLVNPPVITGGAAAVDTAASLFIEGAPSGASKNYSLVVGSGPTRLGGYVEMVKGTDPGPVSPNTARLFVRDNGAGKTQLCVQFPSGVPQCFATE